MSLCIQGLREIAPAFWIVIGCILMQSKETTVEGYLESLPEDRRAAISQMRALIRKSIDKKTEEGMQYGMISYFVPHKIYPAGYHCNPKQPLPFLCLASQKNYMSLYMFCAYVQGDGNAEEKWFRDAWAKTGKKLDMGKSCIRFKKIDDLPLEVVAQAIKRMTVKDHIAQYEANLAKMKKPPKKK